MFIEQTPWGRPPPPPRRRREKKENDGKWSRCWREGGGGGGTDNRMNFEWSITPRIRTRAPPLRAPAGVEELPPVLLENGKYFSAYTSRADIKGR